jgi:hypothetical protein
METSFENEVTQYEAVEYDVCIPFPGWSGIQIEKSK